MRRNLRAGLVYADRTCREAEGACIPGGGLILPVDEGLVDHLFICMDYDFT